MVTISRQPFFSITTPCYNSEKTIGRTLDSILHQSFKDYEYIIIDGGSTDGTLEIIKKYESLFEGRLKWNSESDKGIYDAFNKGIRKSSGLFCWNVNSDDYVEPEALSKIANFIKSNSIGDGVIVFSMRITNSDGKECETVSCNRKEAAKANKKDWMIPHPSTIVSKSIYDKYGLYDDRFRICGDMDWFHRIYSKGINMEFSEIPIISFSIGGISTKKNYKKEVSDRYLFLKKKYSNPFRVICKLIVWHWYYINTKY